ncbi:hypothetical protein [Priestia taiwanensis]|uniref:Uncharacterized protein n=1 Tax=Priestia taiwanensis TaxID=1347902 RepID=A0A917AX00_9BACI|nr:hypothetical protein [Priestia taiwanensis]MBM7364659.1 hypothetical protein [Priestia taiwanensis]GGE78585.1 hypothetical protein GCM10007140_30240 [Priestia taiwanensis]
MGRHPRTPIPSGNYINAQMWYSKNANTGGDGHTRITQHMRDAESLFLSCDRTFTIRNVWAYPSGADSYATSDTQLVAENIDVGTNFSQDAVDVYTKMKGYFPEINVLVCFVEGNRFVENGQPSTYIGYTHQLEIGGDNSNYLILVSESADPPTLAHELGHVLNFSNKNGSANDPNPFPNDPIHNADSDNLMYPNIGGTNITPQQCNQFFDSKIIL